MTPCFCWEDIEGNLDNFDEQERAVHFLAEVDLSGAAAADGVDIDSLPLDSKVYQVPDEEQTMWKPCVLRVLWVPPAATDPVPIGTESKAWELGASLFESCSSWDRPPPTEAKGLSLPHWDGIGPDS